MNWQARAEAVEVENEHLRDEITALRTALGLTREYAPSLNIRLTRTEGEILSLLLGRGYVAREALMAVLYDTRPDADNIPEPKIIDVLICKLRSKIKKLCGAKIETKWGQGYFIPAPDKAVLRTALGEAA